MKKKILSIIVIILIFQSISVIGRPISIEHEKNDSKENSEPACFGYIYGTTYIQWEAFQYPVRFVKIQVNNRLPRMRLLCHYVIGFLQIGKTYEISAIYDGGQVLSKLITLTKDEPVKEVNFILDIT